MIRNRRLTALPIVALFLVCAVSPSFGGPTDEESRLRSWVHRGGTVAEHCKYRILALAEYAQETLWIFDLLAMNAVAHRVSEDKFKRFYEWRLYFSGSVARNWRPGLSRAERTPELLRVTDWETLIDQIDRDESGSVIDRVDALVRVATLLEALPNEGAGRFKLQEERVRAILSKKYGLYLNPALSPAKL